MHPAPSCAFAGTARLSTDKANNVAADDISPILGKVGWLIARCALLPAAFRLAVFKFRGWLLKLPARKFRNRSLNCGLQQLVSATDCQVAIHCPRLGGSARLSPSCLDQFSSDIAPEVHHVTLTSFYFPVNDTPLYYGFEHECSRPSGKQQQDASTARSGAFGRIATLARPTYPL